MVVGTAQDDPEHSDKAKLAISLVDRRVRVTRSSQQMQLQPEKKNVSQAAPSLNSPSGVSVAGEPNDPRKFDLCVTLERLEHKNITPDTYYCIQFKREHISGVSSWALSSAAQDGGSSWFVDFKQESLSLSECEVGNLGSRKILFLGVVKALADGSSVSIGMLKLDTSEFASSPQHDSFPVKIDGESGGLLTATVTMTIGASARAQLSPSSLAIQPPPGESATAAASSRRRQLVKFSLSLDPPSFKDPAPPSNGRVSPTPQSNASSSSTAEMVNPLMKFETQLGPKSSNVLVAVRMRPILSRIESGAVACSIDASGRSITMEEEQRRFDFDHCIGPDVKNAQVFSLICPKFIDNAIEGVNGTMFMYGQTASGKTHTMFGSDTELGLTPLVIGSLFQRIQQLTDAKISVTASYFEIYNEELNDLLDVSRTNVQIRSGSDGAFVADVAQIAVSTAEEAMSVLINGSNNKKMGQSVLNDRSSRSHSIFQLKLKALMVAEGRKRTTTSELCLVDLAGSETLSDRGDSSQRKETTNINLSLSFLKKVIGELAHKEKFVSYRNSALTKILKQSVGGNSRTCVICCISPAKENARDTRNTLMFGTTAKSVVTVSRVNVSDADEKWRDEVRRLREQIISYQGAIKEYQSIEEEYVSILDENDFLRAQLDEAKLSVVAAAADAEERGATNAAETRTNGGNARHREEQRQGRSSNNGGGEEEGDHSQERHKNDEADSGSKQQQQFHDDDGGCHGLEEIDDDGFGDDFAETGEGTGRRPPQKKPPPVARPNVISRTKLVAPPPVGPRGLFSENAEQLRREMLQMKVQHNNEIVRKNEELRQALDRQMRATDEIQDIMKKEDKICMLLEQLHNFLHHGTPMTIIDSSGGGASPTIDKRYLYIVSEGKECFLALCRIDSDNKTPLRHTTYDKISLSDVKRVDLGQFSESFDVVTRLASSLQDDDNSVEAMNLRSVIDRNRMSFSITAKKKRVIDCVCEDESDFEAWVIELNRLLGVSAEWKEKLDISRMDMYERLASEEVAYCSQMHIHPSEYLHAKTQMLKRREKFVTLFDVRSLTKFDLYHSQRFFYFMRTCGWIAQAALFYLTDKFQESAYEEIDL